MIDVNNNAGAVSELDEQNGETITENMKTDTSVSEELPPIAQSGEGETEQGEQKIPLKERIEKIVNNETFVKVSGHVLFALKLLPTAFCVLQLLIWGFSIGENYKAYWDALIELDYVNIAVSLMSLGFIVALVIACAKDVIYIIKDQEEILFETLSTYIAFYLFKSFAQYLFVDRGLVVSHLSFSPFLTLVTVFVLIYAIIRLFSVDIASRWYGILFSAIAIILASVMFTGNIGNFATFNVFGLDVELSDLNIAKWIGTLLGENEGSVYDAMMVAGDRVRLNMFGSSADESIVFFLLLSVQLIVANVLPFVAVSMFGYLIFGLLSKNYVQFMKLNSCKKATIAMLVTSCLSLAATICMSLALKTKYTGVTMQINYGNMVLTILLIVALLVVVMMPWKIYNIIYKHHYSVYRKSKEGGSL